MVRLDRIVTRAGDGGTTALGDGRRVRKTDPRIEAAGCVDELCSLLGVVRLAVPREARRLVASVQNDLFDVGADLAVPESFRRRALRISAAHVARLEGLLARAARGQKPLSSFVLPGGTPAAAWGHLARAVCRRAERRVAAVAKRDRMNPEILRYLNRLSDLLFVLARGWAGSRGREPLWEPGKFAGGRPGRRR